MRSGIFDGAAAHSVHSVMFENKRWEERNMIFIYCCT